jgi:SNF family Na+-dependent transporter
MPKQFIAKQAAPAKRDAWGSRLGAVLAVAGSAVGLGNFLRFPAQVAKNGGGAFMIPYFIAFLLLGIPLMWLEWSLGRRGGAFGHGSAPGAFASLGKSRFGKYLGALGVFNPLIIYIYYTYIESWLLAYAFFALINAYAGQELVGFLKTFQGLNGSPIYAAYFFFVVTFLANIFVLRRGISGGIEKLARWGMPLLLALAVILMGRVLTLPNVWDGFGYFWNPDFSRLKDASVWLAAGGQVFYSLSVGMGIIVTYASYLQPKDDVALSGLTSAATNEFFEVIVGGSLIIPAAFVFFGAGALGAVAQGGSFNLGFVTMPLIFQQMPLGNIFACLWFALLFVAGITSSVSIAQPVIAFLQDELRWPHKKSVHVFAAATFVLCQPAVFFLGRGVLDELDFWGGSFLLVVLALLETLYFVWGFGLDNVWDEIHRGARLTLPAVYRFILKYITPAILLVIMGAWFWQDALPKFLLTNVGAADRPYIIGTWLAMLALFLGLLALIKLAWRHQHSIKTERSR